ncbi:MAG: U32 family peptidase, partial [Halobacteriovoraceae bacterium]|nr:U32 family peptidase [Halobacteriovoraceae bacterium]
MSEIMHVPELLIPAGNLDKLKVAISYGANAVYLGGLKFGLRSAADNFTKDELLEGVNFAHAKGSLVYVVLNGFLHDSDLIELIDFIKYLEKLKVDAVIVSDLGVIETVKAHTNLEIHLSTQASCLNTYSAKLWKKMGVTRIVLGREVSIAQAREIKQAADIEIEMFIHGSMCMAYSGNCVISNFTQGRDSNRGGCAHSCRFEYSLDYNQSELERKKTYFMSSKDLNGLKVLEQFIEAGIDSIKIEGRMKSHLYAATMSKVYAQALKYYMEHGHFLSDQLETWESELAKVTHREYAAANLVEKASRETIFNEREYNKSGEYVMVGRVVDKIENE